MCVCVCYHRLFIAAAARGPRLFREDLCIPVGRVNAAAAAAASARDGGKWVVGYRRQCIWSKQSTVAMVTVTGHTPEHCHGTAGEGGGVLSVTSIHKM